MSINKNKGEIRTTGKTFEDHKMPGEAAQIEKVTDDGLGDYEAFDNEVGYKNEKEISKTTAERIKQYTRVCHGMGKSTGLAVFFGR